MRPSRYKKEYSEQALKLCKLGATDKDLADFFNVSEVTINAWKKRHKEFLKPLKEGKNYFDDQIENALAKKALGYSHPDEKIFISNGEIIRASTTKHYPPDTTACIFWLKNRKPDQWREKNEFKHDIQEGVGVLKTPPIMNMEDWIKLSKQANKDLEEKEKEFDKKYGV